MVWYKKPGLYGIKDSTKPRPLTTEEIEYILDGIPLVESHDDTINEYRRNNIIVPMREQLKEVELPPNMIDEYRIRASNMCYDSMEPAGASGTTSTNTATVKMTQDSLSSFHHSGSAETSSVGTGKLASVFNANTSFKDRTMTVHFLDKTLTRVQAYDIVKKWITVKMGDIIRDHIVYSGIQGMDIETPWWSHYNKSYWSTYYPTYATDNRPPKLVGVLRVYLNVELILMRGIPIGDIVRVISSNSTYIFYGSVQDGYIDIITRDHIKKIFRGDVKSHFNEMSYLKTYVLEGIKDEVVSGYFKKTDKDDRAEYITDVEIVTVHINDMVEVTDKGSNIWTIKSKDAHVPIKVLMDTMLRGKVLDESDIEKMVRAKGGILVLKSEKNLRKALVSAQPDIGYTYVVTYGSAYESIMLRVDVDKAITVTNDVRAINKVLGIEAAQKFLEETFRGIVGAQDHFGEHTDLVISSVTRDGKPKPVGSGTAESSLGIISNSAARAAAEKLTRGALTESEETTGNLVTAVLTGSKMKLGTGYNDIVVEDADGKHTITIEGNTLRVKIGDEIYEVENKREEVDIAKLLGETVSNAEDVSLNFDVVKKVALVNKMKEIDYKHKSTAFLEPPKMEPYVGKINKKLLK